MQLTLDQENARAAFAGFMLSDDKEMVISGPAGVGKSTLLKHLVLDRPQDELADVMNRGILKQWAFTATTNKAAEVLQESMGLEASTVHSRLGLRVFNDYATGKTKIQRGRDSSVLYDHVLVVDEASMVDTPLRKMINECTYNCKILYVGDHCQMAPVMEPISPVFGDNDPVMLRQIVRSQHTPAITELANQLRETVETGVFRPIREVPGIIDFLSPEEAQEEVTRMFVNNEPDARILAYTNQKVIRLNDHIRSLNELPDYFTEGEKVVSCSAARVLESKTMLRIEQELTITEVGGIEEYRLDRHNSLQVRKMVTSVGVVMVPVDPYQFAHLVKHYQKNKDWPTYFSLKEDIADLRPRNACTVYKAQGSTYREVFVDLTDIGDCRNPSQAARMLYVACTRPTHNIKFIGNLPARFKGE